MPSLKLAPLRQCNGEQSWSTAGFLSFDLLLYLPKLHFQQLTSLKLTFQPAVVHELKSRPQSARQVQSEPALQSDHNHVKHSILRHQCSQESSSQHIWSRCFHHFGGFWPGGCFACQTKKVMPTWLANCCISHSTTEPDHLIHLKLYRRSYH